MSRTRTTVLLIAALVVVVLGVALVPARTPDTASEGFCDDANWFVQIVDPERGVVSSSCLLPDGEARMVWDDGRQVRLRITERARYASVYVWEAVTPTLAATPSPTCAALWPEWC